MGNTKLTKTNKQETLNWVRSCLPRIESKVKAQMFGIKIALKNGYSSVNVTKYANSPICLDNLIIKHPITMVLE